MEVAYYPGCSGHGMTLEYQLSTAAVFRHLGIDIREVEDWNCCGASAAHSVSHALALELNLRNLELVEKMGLSQVTTPCAGCYSRLKTAEKLRSDEVRAQKRKAQVPGARVSHTLQFLMQEIGPAGIRGKMVRPLKGLRLAAYYGCLLTRPRKLADWDDPEQPNRMDELLKALGAETVEWSHKTECCGAGMAACRTDIVLDLSGEILKAAKQAGADAITVACPLCQTNLDTRQAEIEALQGTKYGLPVIYFTQLMGISFGYGIKELGLHKLITDAVPLLKAKGLVSV